MAQLPVLIDANLLLLLVVVLTGTENIGKHKRLQQYDAADFKSLKELIAQFDEIVLCPNVATETSNLIRHTGEPLRSEVSRTLGVIVQRAKESTIASAAAVDREEYLRLGLTDAVLLMLSASGAMLLTSDIALYVAAERAGLPVTNFTHIQAQRPDFS